MRTPVLVAAFLVAVTAQLLGREPAHGQPSALSQVRTDNGGFPFAGDRPDLVTVSPNGDGVRDAVSVSFRLSETSEVTLEVLVENNRAIPASVLGSRTRTLGAGPHRMTWEPPSFLEPRTYRLRLLVDGIVGPELVVRVLGVDAGFTRQFYRPGERATLVVSSDAKRLRLRLFRAGPETRPNLYAGYGTNALHGVPAGGERELDWSPYRSRPHRVRVRLPDGPSGLYFARLESRDGRVGFAPFVLLPHRLGRHRVAVVFPTNTWQAYNHRDADGDGTGDTWYALDSIERVDLSRPYLHRGVPTRFRAYQLGFLRWLYRTQRHVDFLTDRQLDRLEPQRLARLYDLVVFLGHHEYMTRHAYDATAGYRDLGGNLMFLSATNFLYRVEHHGHWLYRKEPWRELGRPEAGLVGVQYLSNDFGRNQGRYEVVGASVAPWAFRGTGLADGSTFGHGGIEIDARAPASPHGTIVLATMRDLHGPERSAEMTYYETRSGAKVFAAGTLNFAGTALEPTVSAVLENVWRKLARP
jgi:hypothetical protein